MNLAHAPDPMESERVSPEETRSILFEYIREPQCKRLIGKIHRAQRERGIKSIVMLGVTAGASKTLSVSALALGFMTLLDQRVLILDTVSQTQDESFYLHGIASRPAIASRREVAVVDVLTSRALPRQVGIDRDELTPLPADERSLTTRRPHGDTSDFYLKPFVDSIREHYDLILIDTSPLTAVTRDTFDPLILAGDFDASILVLSSQEMSPGIISETLSQLQRYDIAPLGVIADRGEC